MFVLVVCTRCASDREREDGEIGMRVEKRKKEEKEGGGGGGWGGVFFFFQAEDGIRDHCVTGVQTCALPIWKYTKQRYFLLASLV